VDLLGRLSDFSLSLAKNALATLTSTLWSAKKPLFALLLSAAAAMSGSSGLRLKALHCERTRLRIIAPLRTGRRKLEMEKRAAHGLKPRDNRLRGQRDLSG